MLIRDLPLSDNLETGPGALRMLARGFPLARTMDAIAAMAAQLQRNTRCAILVMEDDHLAVAAENDLRPPDRSVLAELCSRPETGHWPSFALQHCAEIRPLVTQTAELVGAVVLFDVSRPENGNSVRQLDQICSLATLAIEQKHLSEELSYRAHHDSLTHLWNGVWMDEEVGRVLEIATETQRFTGLLQIGIDSFRVLNSLLGRQPANGLLREVAMRLIDALEPGFSLGRCGGDEFAILMPNLKSAGRVAAYASHVLTWFEKPFLVGGHELLARVTIGTAIAGPGECEVGELQNRADTALRYGKKRARGRVSAFKPSMVTMPPERLVMEQHLRFALQKREFELYYQPQVTLPTGEFVAVEALLRWRHATLGFISPGTFVPIAEEIGIIEEIGDWVIGEALRQLERWHKAGLNGFRVAVNVSAHQFARGDFGATVARRLKSSTVKPEDLEIEITESAVMTDFERGLRQLRLLRSLGVGIALDDFGTGHSSLAYLQQLPIQRLKIDRMFVTSITGHASQPPLLAGIIQMGHALGCSVIAEGVETAEQALALTAMGCTEMQGFLYAKPLPACEVLPWTRSRTGQIAPGAIVPDGINCPRPATVH